MVLVEDDSQAGEHKDKLFECFDEWISMNEPCNLKSSLWFIPLHEEGHYCCVCINFPKKQVEILDNQIHGKGSLPKMRRTITTLVCLSFCIAVNLRLAPFLSKSLILFPVCFDVGIVLMYC